MRIALIGIACLSGLLQASLPVGASGHSAKTLKDYSPSMVPSKAQCVQQILAYRGAISHLDGRIKNSPKAITFVSAKGDKFIVENRFLRQMEYNKSVLHAGLVAKVERCASVAS